MDSDELRELYANLLAKSMNKNTKSAVHPAFVEIIKQMSPNDAAYFRLLTSTKIKMIADIKGYTQCDEIYDFIKRNANFFSDSFTEDLINISIDNLSRLGLIEISSQLSGVDLPIQYESLMKRFQEEYNVSQYPQYKRIDMTYKSINITSLGALFNSVCVEEL